MTTKSSWSYATATKRATASIPTTRLRMASDLASNPVTLCALLTPTAVRAVTMPASEDRHKIRRLDDKKEPTYTLRHSLIMSTHVYVARFPRPVTPDRLSSKTEHYQMEKIHTDRHVDSDRAASEVYTPCIARLSLHTSRRTRHTHSMHSARPLGKHNESVIGLPTHTHSES
jgi:hypothetical protein